MGFKSPTSQSFQKIKLDNLDNYSQYSFNLEKVSSSGTPMVRNHSNSHISNTPSSVYVREQLSQFQNKNSNKFKKLKELTMSVNSPTYFQSLSTPQNPVYLNTTASNSLLNSETKKPLFKSPNLVQRQLASASKIVSVSQVQLARGIPKKIEFITEDINQATINSAQKELSSATKSENQQESFFTKEQKQKLSKLKKMYKNIQEQQEAELKIASKLQEELNQQVSGDKKVFYGPIEAVHEFENQIIGEAAPMYSASPSLNKKIIKLHTEYVPDAIMNPQQQLQQIHNQSYTAYESVKQSRIESAKLYRNAVASMSKQIKPVSKEFEELKQKLNGKHTDQIEKILIKLSIINIDKNQRLKDNANNQIVFDKMMTEICKKREKVTKHSIARTKVKEKLNEEDLKINYVNIPKFDSNYKKDFFVLDNQTVQRYRKYPDDLIDLIQSYSHGQEQLIESLKDQNAPCLFDINKFSESEFDPYFTNIYLKEVMSKHLIFKKGQKLDFFGKKQIKKRTIEDILNKFNHPSQCSSSFDSESSFYYLSTNEQLIEEEK
ncbi:hypothetical protein TTHERM_00717890 (macronuclear) [Tetrahymena thermophila SB210]|uniref:Uncharacterized protein n=1 Tax=Tetrahymena thermophila (strain SB210) TaxID=312017 RepID=Q23E90_TETTS|nr:hypothetical protein TTHERM_00717890 [Tetrahymena thermophila SB210]EAR94863.1 hypothetical protein TTHERM_00717890 [Tetrahymena thermophila SB210]|eukprot:XP_001015108.1 hypothetical protein TTHERM_00717890 [Tetrahymena thermophila SB210]